MWRVIGLFFVVSFLIWTAQHSIFRYLMPLFILSGALIVVLLRHVLRSRRCAPTAIVIVTIALVASTKINDWGRIEFGPQVVRRRHAAPDPNALVLLDEPGADVVRGAVLSRRTRGSSASTTRSATPAQDADGGEIRRMIREHRGPIYSLAYPKGAGIDALLERGLCRSPRRACRS